MRGRVASFEFFAQLFDRERLERDVDTVSLAYGADELLDPTSGDARSLYSLDYLRDVSRAIPTDAAVDLQLGTDAPMSLSFDLADGHGAVEYVLPPRIARE